jgi:hypothetical protein
MATTTSKFSQGAFVFTRARGINAVSTEEVAALAVKHGIDEKYIPSYAGDRTAVSRAIDSVKAGLQQKENLVLLPIVQKGDEVTWGIVEADKVKLAQGQNPEFLAALRWQAEPDPSVVQGEHDVAKRVAVKYQDLRGKVVADDWTKSISAYFEAHDASRVRGDGRIYWAPPQRLDAIRRFGAFISEVGIDLVLCEVEAEAQVVVQAVASESLAEQLQKLEEEAAAFDGTQKPSTYTKRLEEYQALRERAGLYKAALGIGVEQAVKVLADLDIKVNAMLDIRKSVVLHRGGNGSTPVAETAPEVKAAAASPEGLRLSFGGACFQQQLVETDGTMLFTSSEAAAREAVLRMSAMGLSGKPMVSGKVKVVVQNSGPVGHEVSLRLTMSGGNVYSNAVALAQLGVFTKGN